MKKKYEKQGFAELSPIYKIHLENSHNLIFKEYNSLIKLNSQALYNIENRKVNIYKNIKVFTNFKNNIENKLAYNNMKNRLENSIYTTYFSRFHQLFQKSFVRLSLRNLTGSPVRLFIGNIYVDNVYFLKSKLCIGKKPKLNLKYIVSVDEVKNSKIELKTRNLDYFKAKYKVDLIKSVNLNIASEFYISKKFNNDIELNYSYSKYFIFSISSCFHYKIGNKDRIKNKINFGFSFNGFKFCIPIYLSKFENKSSLFELMFVNIMSNITGYFINFLYRRLFCEIEYE